MMLKKTVLILVMNLVFWPWVPAEAGKKKVKKAKPEQVKIIPKSDFMKALTELSADERIPVASSTLVEKGRGEEYYSAKKMFDNNPETFWAEGAKGFGHNQWVAFNLPDGSTHVEITPGAGKEEFENFNRPRQLYLDIYLIKLKRDQYGEYNPKAKWLGRNVFKLKNKPKPIRQKLSVKLPELVLADRTMYVGVIIVRKVYKGQFDDTSISSVKVSQVWGDQ